MMPTLPTHTLVSVLALPIHVVSRVITDFLTSKQVEPLNGGSSKNYQHQMPSFIESKSMLNVIIWHEVLFSLTIIATLSVMIYMQIMLPSVDPSMPSMNEWTEKMQGWMMPISSIRTPM